MRIAGLAVDIVQQVLDSNIKESAKRNDLSDEEIESMLRGQVSQILNINLSQVKRLGIDEIALVKGQGNPDRGTSRFRHS